MDPAAALQSPDPRKGKGSLDFLLDGRQPQRNQSAGVDTPAANALSKLPTQHGTTESSPALPKNPRPRSPSSRRRLPRAGSAPAGRLTTNLSVERGRTISRGPSARSRSQSSAKSAGAILSSQDDDDGGYVGETTTPPGSQTNARLPLSTDEKRERRRLKNRESAQRSRARRMVKLDNLEKMVNALTEENRKLKEEISVLETRPIEGAAPAAQYFAVGKPVAGLIGKDKVTGEEAATLLNQLVAKNMP
eukprot:CAMPEP_0198308768 /NCGR_PEP_ID=MMETSP1450-20131203/1340_1 /TAXON_ID=753684 ORGANISM="Madagascaria erythrocladiodes, Strain CCMP3234" /NCGR_SAMPLE_ID=MMETSP1450 /ASSEMBLY_ACC=CAM_ASM_001115 /LENGTH=247 /DNA_ID=CAMNT_0044011475 /DNA_START=114 /DNA_END=857 /DNA_ORIENTATION=+